MRFTANPLLSLVIAVASFLCLAPLSLLVAGRAHLVEGVVFVGIVGIVGALGALLGLGRVLTYLAQVVAAAGVVAWRAIALGPPDVGPLDSAVALIREGSHTIATAAAPVPDTNGIVWLLLLLTALVQLMAEMLVNGLEQPAWSFAPLALGYVIASIAADQELGLGRFAIVAGSYVLVLLIATGIGEGHRTTKASRSGTFQLTRAALAAVLALIAVGCAAIVGPLLPLGPKQPWQNQQSGPIQLGDPTVALNENLRRPQDQPVLTYRTSTGQSTYLRTVALPDLTTDGARLVSMRLRNSGLESAYEAPGEQIDVAVQMEAVPSEYLPVPFAVDAFAAEGVWSFDPETLAIVATGEDRTQQTVGLAYEATSTLPTPTIEELNAASAGVPSDPITLSVPEIDPRVADLTRSVVANATTDGEKAQAIQDFLRSAEFEYSLDAPQTATLDVISSFLLDARSGYCIHFAAGMMTMARVEGIPSRMAVGFNSGSLQADGSYVVTSHNMHAWPELYFEGLGWVPFEPTPSVASPPGYTGADPSEPGEPTASPSPSATAAPPSPDPVPLPPSPSPAPNPEGGDEGDAAWLLPVLSIVAALAVLAAVPFGTRMLVGRWRLRPRQEPAELAANAWREVRATFVDTRRELPEGSPGPSSRAAAGSLPDGALLTEVGETVERALYSRADVDTSALPEQVARLRKSLYASGPGMAKWLPRSLWQP